MTYFLEADFSTANNQLSISSVAPPNTRTIVARLQFDCDTVLTKFTQDGFVNISANELGTSQATNESRVWSLDVGSTKVFIDGSESVITSLSDLFDWLVSRRSAACGAIAGSSSSSGQEIQDTLDTHLGSDDWRTSPTGPRIEATLDAYLGTDWKTGGVASGTSRVFLDNTTVAPAISGQPTVAEITTAHGGVSTNVLLYYTGTDTAGDAPTYVYWVDDSGAVTQIEETGIELDLTSIAQGEMVVWDAANSKFARTPTVTNDTASADIILTSTGMPNYYGVGSDRTEATLNVDESTIVRGAVAKISSNTGAAFPSFTSTGGTVTFKIFGDTASYDSTSTNIITLEVVDSTAGAEIVWVTFTTTGATSGGGGSLNVPWVEETGFPNSTTATGTYTSSVLSDGTLDLYGSGKDISGSGDEIIYWYSPDVVQVSTTYQLISASTTEAVAGNDTNFNSGAGPYLMIRPNSLDDQDKMVAVATNPDNPRFQQKRRTSFGGGVSETNDSPGGSYTTNLGFRLVVDGSGNVDAFYSQDGGMSWTGIGPTYTDLAAEITGGTCTFGFGMDSHTTDASKVTRVQGTFQII